MSVPTEGTKVSVCGTALVTGATGFIGRRLRLSGERALVRRAEGLPNGVVGDLLDPASLAKACAGIECVFHCAGYAHAFSSSDPDAHWHINFEGTRNLLQAAGEAGVRRFVFLSSVKAMAEPGDACVDEDWPGEPDEGTYVVADPKAYSGREIYDAIRRALGKPPARWRVPATLLRCGGKLGDGLGKLAGRTLPLNSEVAERLLGSACHSPARIERELGGRAGIGLDEGVREMLERGLSG